MVILEDYVPWLYKYYKKTDIIVFANLINSGRFLDRPHN